VSFGSLLGRERVLDLVASHQDLHERRLADYRAKRHTLGDPYLEATLAFGIAYERAVLAWIADVPELLRDA
jgi:hypothetical protein